MEKKSEKERRLEEYKELLTLAKELKREIESEEENPAPADYGLFAVLLLDRRFGTLTEKLDTFSNLLSSTNNKLSYMLGAPTVIGSVIIGAIWYFINLFGG